MRLGEGRTRTASSAAARRQPRRTLPAKILFLLTAFGLAVTALSVPLAPDAQAQTVRQSESYGKYPAAGTTIKRTPRKIVPTRRTVRTPTHVGRNPGIVRRVTPGRGGKVTDGGYRQPTGGGHKPRYPRRPRFPIGPGIVVGVPIIGVPIGPPVDAAQPPSFGGGASPPPRRRAQPPRRAVSGVPPANERRYVPDEVVIEVNSAMSAQAVAALVSRHRLNLLESLTSQLVGATLLHLRIPDRRSVPAVIRAVETDGAVVWAQPNYVALVQQEPPPAAAASDPAQYAPIKLRLPQAHALAKGDKVLIAVIDSGIDAAHPELTGVIAKSFNALGSDEKADAHGTAIAGAIAARAKLMGVAPGAQLLAVRAFAGKDGTTFSILKGLDWAAANGARIINMSFAGPKDPVIARSLAAARAKGIILIAAAGNAGWKSPPLYPAADPNVIAVTATDADDKLFADANRGGHIAVAAPGVDVLLPAPDAAYQVTSGTSFAAAEVSGAVALMLERKPDLDQDTVRRALTATARDLGPRGRDTRFGAGLVDAYRAILAIQPAAAAEAAKVVPAANRP